MEQLSRRSVLEQMVLAGAGRALGDGVQLRRALGAVVADGFHAGGVGRGAERAGGRCL